MAFNIYIVRQWFHYFVNHSIWKYLCNYNYRLIPIKLFKPKSTFTLIMAPNTRNSSSTNTYTTNRKTTFSQHRYALAPLTKSSAGDLPNHHTPSIVIRNPRAFFVQGFSRSLFLRAGAPKLSQLRAVVEGGSISSSSAASSLSPLTHASVPRGVGGGVRRADLGA